MFVPSNGRVPSNAPPQVVICQPCQLHSPFWDVAGKVSLLVGLIVSVRELVRG